MENMGTEEDGIKINGSLLQTCSKEIHQCLELFKSIHLSLGSSGSFVVTSADKEDCCNMDEII